MLFLLLLLAHVPVPSGATADLVAAPSARVAVPAGPFRMGATEEDLQAARRLCAEELRGGGALMLELSPRCGSRFDAEAPQTEVFLDAYEIDRTEVTVGAYAACVRDGACRSAPELRLAGGDARLPVERVTWPEAAAFCRWRGGRLPSEAEWEKAARGLGTRVYPWGRPWRDRHANHGRSQRLAPGPSAAGDDDTLDDADGFAGRAPVGSYPGGASAHGALDMAGNVWEWTSGYFSREPPQALARFDPRGPLQGDERAIRGGSYRSPPSDLRVSRRVGLAPGERAPGVGFRCAYDVVQRAPAPPRVAAQMFIWIQHHQQRGARLDEHLDEALAATRRAGFEAVQGWLDWFEGERAEATGRLLARHRLTQRAAYTGGAMHEEAAAATASERILARARRAKAHGLEVVVLNPDALARDKTDAELAVQARALDRLGAALAAEGLRLAIHAHDREMRAGAREWFHILRNTRPEHVGFCVDLHWALRGGQDPLALLRAARGRLHDVHLRNSEAGVWREELGPGDIDHAAVARLLGELRYSGTLTVELAYEARTPRTRPLEENLARSRAFVRRVFGE